MSQHIISSDDRGARAQIALRQKTSSPAQTFATVVRAPMQKRGVHLGKSFFRLESAGDVPSPNHAAVQRTAACPYA